jgi:hypothetical protein
MQNMTNEKLERLKKQKQVLEARIRQEQNRENKAKRKAATRRKILAGAAVLDEAESNAAYKNTLYELLARFLIRDDDRALFGFSPLPDSQISLINKLPAKSPAPEETK